MPDVKSSTVLLPHRMIDFFWIYSQRDFHIARINAPDQIWTHFHSFDIPIYLRRACNISRTRENIFRSHNRFWLSRPWLNSSVATQIFRGFSLSFAIECKVSRSVRIPALRECKCRRFRIFTCKGIEGNLGMEISVWLRREFSANVVISATGRVRALLFFNRDATVGPLFRFNTNGW